MVHATTTLKSSGFRILSVPARGSGNPYIDLFYDTLEPHGIELVGRLKFDKQWFDEHLSEFDAVHLHWPESLWRPYTYPTLKKLQQSNIPGTWRLSEFVQKSFHKHIARESLNWLEEVLTHLKKNRKKVIWTWHNYEPHENMRKQDIKGQSILAQYADLIIFHSEYAKKRVESSYDIRGNTVVMPHGNYEGVYPEPRNRATVISELNLDPNLPIVGMLGHIRQYKGVDIAIDACLHLRGQVQFLCAGDPFESYDWAKIVKRAALLKHCALIPRFISDQEFSDYANASDVLLLPYRSVTSSGALLAALTLGKGVVASDLPFFREVLGGHENAGILFFPNTADGLSTAISQYLQISGKTREDAAYNLALKFRWNDMVVDVVRSINQLRLL